MSAESYPCYIRIGDEKDAEEMLELPTEDDGTICLSTIQSQYADAIGLRFKSESGSWRGVKLSDNIFSPPLEGWGQADYFVTYPKAGVKRKGDDDADGNEAKTKKITEQDMLQDLIVLGLPYTATEEEMKEYFEKFGDLDMYRIKTDPGTNKSRGFGFVRFKTVEVVEAVLAAEHTIKGRKCQVRFPTSKTGGGQQNDIPTKLFVGRLAGGTTTDDLREHFSSYGVLTDVYIPAQFRGFGFVTFASPAVAQAVLNKQHQIKGNIVNLSFPTPKGGADQMQPQQQMGMQYGGGYGNMQGYNMQANMLRGMQGNMQSPQGARGYGFGNQGNIPQGYGNQGNNPQGYYSSHFKPGGQMQN